LTHTHNRTYTKSPAKQAVFNQVMPQQLPRLCSSFCQCLDKRQQ